MTTGPSWSWSYSSWTYNYLCNQYLSPLMLWVRILIRAMCTALCDKVDQWLGTGLWFSPDPPVSSTNKIDRHDITEILLKVALSTIKQTNNLMSSELSFSHVILMTCYAFDEMRWLRLCTRPIQCARILIVQQSACWHVDTQIYYTDSELTSILLFNIKCLTEKQQTSISYYLVWLDMRTLPPFCRQ
jgi:hypothetical protein